MDFVAIDFETTGYEAGGTNEPWQLGAAFVQGDTIIETREWFFNRGVTLMEQWEDVYPALIGQRLVAHNIACEKTLLTRLAPLTKWGPWVDTLKFAKSRYPQLPSYKLGDLCETFGCVPQMFGRTWHDGLYDAVACAQLALYFRCYG